MNYTITNLEQDIAEIICKSDSKEAFLKLTDELKVTFITFLIVQIKAFLLGRYNMTFEESGKVLQSFSEGVIKEDTFLSKVTELVKADTVGGVQ